MTPWGAAGQTPPGTALLCETQKQRWSSLTTGLGQSQIQRPEVSGFFPLEHFTLRVTSAFNNDDDNYEVNQPVVNSDSGGVVFASTTKVCLIILPRFTYE